MIFAALAAGAEVRIVTRSMAMTLPHWMTASLAGEVEAYLRLVADRRRIIPLSEFDQAAELPPPIVDPDAVRQIYPLPEVWATYGLCGDIENADDIYFGIEDVGLTPNAVIRARGYCSRCPVIAECLRTALENNEQFGIWGGTTGRDRSGMRKRLRQGVTVDELVAEVLK